MVKVHGLFFWLQKAPWNSVTSRHGSREHEYYLTKRSIFLNW